jgi:hypothetical protein
VPAFVTVVANRSCSLQDEASHHDAFQRSAKEIIAVKRACAATGERSYVRVFIPSLFSVALCPAYKVPHVVFNRAPKLFKLLVTILYVKKLSCHYLKFAYIRLASRRSLLTHA